jgi:RHS repeat-associated protein
MKHLGLLLVVTILSFSANLVRAQVGNDNPTGPSGVFNGNVNTACSYDPYTGNASRSVVDLSMAGGVGSYPLTFARTSNSRYQASQSYQFGGAGGWRHSYTWEIDDSDILDESQYSPVTSYSVHFPDGRTINFGLSDGDIYFRGGPGIRERFQPRGVGNLAYLILPDGGKVEFLATLRNLWDSDTSTWRHYFSYRAQAIIDPSGLRTTFTYNSDGSLNTIQEPAGRWIQLVYVTTSWITSHGRDKVIHHITGSDGRQVFYNYSIASFAPGSATYTRLDNVVYPSDPGLSAPTAYYSYQAPNVPDYWSGYDGYPLLSTASDPMYAGPMKNISYTYATSNNADGSSPVVGQILSENSGATGQPVSSLTVYGNTRTDTRGDGPSRTFTYLSAFLQSDTDFYNVAESFHYDANGYTDQITDRNQHTTTLQRNPLNGNVTRVTFPSTPGDTPSGTPQGTIVFTYGGSGSLDPNNSDANNPYYLFSVEDEAHNVTKYWRTPNKRIEHIDYPDTGYEAFTYNSFGQPLTHQLRTGGAESFSYTTSGLLETYRGPDHASGNPTTRYQYGGLNTVSGETYAPGAYLGDPTYTTSRDYNARGQLTVTTLPTDPVDGIRHTIVNAYNPNNDGTLSSVTDPLGHVTSYTYDDYKRLRTATTPQRFSGDTTPRTTYLSYDTNQGTGDDYTHTDANVTRLTLPSGKLARISYDPNFRKSFVTASAADGVTDASTTGFIYDYAGNLTTVKRPDPSTGQASSSRATNFNYDERNRLYSTTDAINPATTRTYDAGGRLSSEQRPNGQTITYDSYDAMNRVLQQTVGQYPSPNAVTINTYWPSGLLHTMRDPNQNVYTYVYDLLGRKTSVTYPPDSGYVTRSDSYTYDAVTGNLVTHTNRAGNIQTFTFDNLNRQTHFEWNDGSTPWQNTVYDAASRVKQVINTFATVNFDYLDDNLLNSQREITASNDHTNTYTYDADGNRASITYPSTYQFQHNYNGRNQPGSIVLPNYGTVASYAYDRAGNRQQRSLHNQTVTDYAPVDALDRSSWVRHTFTGGQTAQFDYAFDEVNRLKYEQRDSGTADGYSYDKAGQIIGMIWNGTFSSGTVNGPTLPLSYDAAGNRTGTWGIISYSANHLNEYTEVDGSPITSDAKGNLESYNGWTYTYDAQNRLQYAVNGGTTLQFWYDGLNRQIVRYMNVNGAVTITRSVWDGWNLIEERDQNDSPVEFYLHGARTDELVARFGGAYGTTWYCQDGRGNTSHLVGDGNEVLERYKYGLAGEPQIFDPSGNARSQSAWDNRFLFQGREYLKETGLYDYRNRFYLFGLGRFLQPDPTGFAGDPSNLYRYCGGDPVNRSDASGLGPKIPLQKERGGAEGVADRITVSDTLPDFGLEWRDVNSLGGLGNLTQGGGRGTGDGGGFTLTRSLDSNQVGRVRQAQTPRSTQGFWTSPDGLPTGSAWVALIEVLAAIEEGPEAGVKVYQWAEVNIFNEILDQGGAIGFSKFDQVSFHGLGTFSATNDGSDIFFKGHVWSAVLGEDFAIDYRFWVNLSPLNNSAFIIGIHDAYPSYMVNVNGTPIYYFHEQGGPIGGPILLASPFSPIFGWASARW